jgi:acid phosphatase type 7
MHPRLAPSGALPLASPPDPDTRASSPAILGRVRRPSVVLIALLVLVAAPATAAAKPRLALSRGAAEAGQRISLAGHGFPRAARLRVVLGGATVKRARTGPRGGFRLRIRLPAMRPDRYRLTARAGRRAATRSFRIRAPKAGESQPVPFTPGPDAPAPIGQPSPPPPPPPPPPPAPTLAAAGDIACRAADAETTTECRHGRTATLVESLAPDAVAPLGDTQYQHGEIEDFEGSYDPTWGRFKSITHPAVGNHEYEGDPERDSAPGYYQYFGAAAGDPSEGYYRWSVGDWTVFALNSGAIDYTRTGGGSAEPDDCWPVSCAAGSAQETWLRDELESLPDDACVLAYWHHPRYSSGYGGINRDYPETAPLYQALHDHGAELVLTGHAHNYERFQPMDADDAVDPVTGITQFVVGTGGRSLFTNPGPQKDTSEQLYTDAFGVLELTLDPGGWSSRFVTEAGEVRDETSGTCHARPAP